MTAAPPPTWPSSRVLAGWWPSLDRLRPRSLWLYHLLLHRVEAPVAVAPPAAQERLARLLLDLLAAPASSPGRATTTRLAAQLHLDPQLLWRLLVELEKTGLVRSGSGEQGWAPTADRPEQMLALFVLSGSDAGEEMLLGLGVQPDGWRLQADRPVLRLGEGWQEVLPELAEEPPPDAWRQAWRAWGQAHGLPLAEVEA